MDQNFLTFRAIYGYRLGVPMGDGRAGPTRVRCAVQSKDERKQVKMARNLKTLGLLFCAMLALGVVIASAASGQTTEKKFHSEIEPTTLTGTALEAQVFRTAANEAVICNTVEITSTIATKTATEIKAIPHYSNCTAESPVGNIPAHIDTNSCYYTFTIDTEIESHHKFSGPVHVKCTTPGDSITVTTTFLGGTQQCLHIPEQTPTVPTVDYTNEGATNTRDIKVTPTVEGITYTKTSICGSGTFNNGTYKGAVTVKGEEDKVNGAQKGIWVT
jgi:hypothetical protein